METTTEPFELANELRGLLRTRVLGLADGTLIVLPVRVVEGVGQYRDEELTMPKELRQLGLPTEFLQAPEERIGLSEYSEQLVLAFMLGVAQNMTWDASKAAVQYIYAKARRIGGDDPDPRIAVSVARIQRSDGSVIDGVTIDGPANAETATRIIQALTGDEAATAELPSEQ
jgi:hypothetical protein